METPPKILRIIDANLNRIGEGLRFLEEIARLDGDAILSGAPTVSADCLPCLAQNVRPEDVVIERMEPAVPAPLGRQV